jgi:hypothetical protein
MALTDNLPLVESDRDTFKFPANIPRRAPILKVQPHLFAVNIIVIYANRTLSSGLNGYCNLAGSKKKQINTNVMGVSPRLSAPDMLHSTDMKAMRG